MLVGWDVGGRSLGGKVEEENGASGEGVGDWKARTRGLGIGD